MTALLSFIEFSPSFHAQHKCPSSHQESFLLYLVLAHLLPSPFLSSLAHLNDCQTSFIDSDRFCWSIPIWAASTLFLAPNQILLLLCLKPFPVSELGISCRPGRQAGDNQTCTCFLGFVIFHHPVHTRILTPGLWASSTYPHPYSRPVEFLTFHYRHLFCCCFYYFAPLCIISPVPGLPLLPRKLLFLHLLRLLDTLCTFFSTICHVILLIWLPSCSISSSLLRAISVSSMIYRIWLINSVHTRKMRVKWIYK